VGTLLALGHPVDCGCLWAGTESFAGPDANVDGSAWTDRYCDCDEDSESYRRTHLHGDAHADDDAGPNLSTDAGPDPNGDADRGANGHTYASTDRHAQSRGHPYTDSHADSEQARPAYANAGPCLCGLACGVL
jgi:hypothetical protein